MNSFNHSGGYILIIHALVFAAVSFIVIGAVAAPLVATNRAAHGFADSAEAYLVAGSAAEETLYKLKNQMQLASSETLQVGAHSATIGVATGLEGKTITIDAEAGDYVRALELKIAESAGASFNYGLQAGRGGFEMSGSSGIQGNVYANGDIIGSGSTFITGSAVVANRSDPVAHQSNTGPMPPTTAVSFGANNTPQDLAQSFTVSTTTPITAVRFYMRRSSSAWANDITVRITTNQSDRPSGTTLASANLAHTQITTAYNYLTVPLSSTPTLTPGTTYWLVLDTSVSYDSTYSVAASASTYAGGLAKTGIYGQSSWNNTSPTGLDLYFDLYVGGETGRIFGTQNGGITIGGDAWAHHVSYTNVSGTLYCQGSQNTNKPCNTSRPGAVEQPMPISDGLIEAWKAEAEAGGVTTGNVSYGGSTQASIGPRKIVGNLTIGGSAVVTMNGTLWVTGNVTVEGSGILKLANSYGSGIGVLVADGRVVGGGSAKYNGNGMSGSYLLVITTSTCPAGSGCSSNPAININGSAGSVILNAQKGTLVFSGSAHANQATAERIVMSGSTIVHYDSGLADPNFPTGPSGSWSVSGWREI